MEVGIARQSAPQQRLVRHAVVVVYDEARHVHIREGRTTCRRPAQVDGVAEGDDRVVRVQPDYKGKPGLDVRVKHAVEPRPIAPVPVLTEVNAWVESEA